MVYKERLMNPSYFKLPLDKRKNLINAGYKVFALSPYKKGSVVSIADNAGISKSLLFYYFTNKKEYYMYLFDTAVEFLNEQKAENIGNEKCDLFELINRSVEQRIKVIHDYPYLFRFVTRAYYESDKEIKLEIQKRKKVLLKIGKEDILKLISYKQFQDPNDAEVLIDIILNIAEGCMRGREDLKEIKIKEILPVFRHMMESLKMHYYKCEL